MPPLKHHPSTIVAPSSGCGHGSKTRASINAASLAFSLAIAPQLWACSDRDPAPDAGAEGSTGTDDAASEGDGADGGIDDDETAPPVDDGTDWAWPGDRLRVLSTTLGDAEHVLALWDTDLEAPCRFAMTATGLACVPTKVVEVDYADPDCNVPVVKRPQASCDDDTTLDTGELVSRVVRDCDVPELEVLELGTAHAGPVYSKTPSTPCRMRQGSADDVFLEARSFPAQALATATERLEAHGELAVRMAYAEDGARQALGFAHPDGTHCTVAPEQASTTRACIPRSRLDTFPGVFAGSSCEGPPVAFWPDQFACDLTQAPEVIVESDHGTDDPCRDRPALRTFERGERFDRISVQFSAQACEPGPQDAVGWAIGAPIDPTAAYPTPEMHRDGAGPFARYWGPTGTGLHVQFDGFELADGSPCRAVPFQDGTERCVPSDVLVIQRPTYFADEACTETLVRTGLQACDPTPEHVVRGTWTQGGACGPVGQEAYALEAYEGPVYEREDNLCVRVSESFESSRAFSRIGASVPSSVFPALHTDVR